MQHSQFNPIQSNPGRIGGTVYLVDSTSFKVFSEPLNHAFSLCCQFISFPAPCVFYNKIFLIYGGQFVNQISFRLCNVCDLGLTGIEFQVTQGVMWTAMSHVFAANCLGKGTATVIRLGNLTTRLPVQTLIFGVGTQMGSTDSYSVCLSLHIHRQT